jgi:hypothetical protein
MVFAEIALTDGGFGLSYNAMNAIDTRSVVRRVEVLHLQRRRLRRLVP